MCSGVRRRYSAAVPEYMRDRPKDMVQKCEVRRIAGELIDVSKVKELGDGFYEVQAESSYFPHRVSLDPMCTCMDFQRHLYPCKHIYAVLSKYGKSFTDLPREYTDSPWFKLDHHVMSVSVLNDSRQSITSVCPDAGHGEYSETLVPDSNIQNENSVHQSLNPFPKKVKLTTTTANSCREMLKELSSLTYLITDITLLHGLEDKLRQTISQVKDHIETSSSGISREPETKTAGRYKPRKKQGNTRSEMKPLPKRAYPNKWTHRVGKVADCKRSRPVNIAVMSRAHQILLKAKKQSHLTSPSKTRSTESGPSQVSRIVVLNLCDLNEIYINGLNHNI